MKIGLLSDTHGYVDPRLYEVFKEADEIWHAGDIGTLQVAEQLSGFKTLRAVHGNIDGVDIRYKYPADQIFLCEEVKIWITHIGGWPGRFTSKIRNRLDVDPLDLFICGHSHILKVMFIKAYNMLYLNPGAAGNTGPHKIRTVLRFIIDGKNIRDLEVIELGLRTPG